LLTPERYQLILSLLKQKRVVKIQEFVDVTRTSESTIRRDLIELEKEGRLKRIHGGATLLQGKRVEPSIFEKATQNLAAKQKIAKVAASFVEPEDSIYLDAGTTTLQMIEHLDQPGITVVTNGLHLIDALLERGIETYVLGGKIKDKTRAFIGRGALESLQTYRFDKCFIGVNSIHKEYGYTTPDPEEALVKMTAISLSHKAIVIADQTKFGEISFSKIADLDMATIITNGPETKQIQEIAKQTFVKVV
jgi:DeoR family fructose operon transcriptional repressor